jgi:hypothetical protein
MRLGAALVSSNLHPIVVFGYLLSKALDQTGERSAGMSRLLEEVLDAALKSNVFNVKTTPSRMASRELLDRPEAERGGVPDGCACRVGRTSKSGCSD